MQTWVANDSERDCVTCDYEVAEYWLIDERPMCELCYDRTIDAGEDPKEVCEYYSALKN